MPTSYADKVNECYEIVDKGVFNDWVRWFIRSMKKRVLMGKPFSTDMKKKIDEGYTEACASPY